jgi:FlaA1/EpsC-like NDP-sugar epimerase
MIPGVDIKIEFNGLRPGEKLYEEFLLGGEGIKKTLRDKIFVINTKVSVESRPLAEAVEEAFAGGGGDVRAALRRFVPKYTYDLEQNA